MMVRSRRSAMGLRIRSRVVAAPSRQTYDKAAAARRPKVKAVATVAAAAEVKRRGMMTPVRLAPADLARVGSMRAADENVVTRSGARRAQGHPHLGEPRRPLFRRHFSCGIGLQVIADAHSQLEGYRGPARVSTVALARESSACRASRCLTVSAPEPEHASSQRDGTGPYNP